MSVNQSETRITTPETCKMFTLYQLLIKMVVKRDITKLKWEKAKNCYSALTYSVFMTAFSNRQYKCFYTTPIFVQSIFHVYT